MVPLMYMTTRFVAFRCTSLAQCMNLDRMLTTYKISCLVALRYIKQPTKHLKYVSSTFFAPSFLLKHLKYVSSTFFAPSFLLSFFFWFIGVLIYLQSSMLNFLRISLAYFFWQMKTSSRLCLISIPRK